jgi:protein ImuB
MSRAPRRVPRRVAAAVVFDLPFQVLSLSSDAGAKEGPFALVYREPSEQIVGASLVDAVNAHAAKKGARVGMRVSEVMAISHEMRIVHLEKSAVLAALASLCEVLMAIGIAIEISPSGDAIWIEITGTENLFGGEEAIVHAVASCIADLGFQARVAIADGPRIAEALARFHSQVPFVAPRFDERDGEGDGRANEQPSVLAPLPLRALFQTGEDAADLLSMFAALGVLTVGDFLALPSAQLSSRLGRRAADILSLVRGIDLRPLVPFSLPETLTERVDFEDGVDTAGQLVFVANHMASRLSLRLGGRGQSCHRMHIAIAYDRTMLACALGRPYERDRVDGALGVDIDLPAPLHRESDLFRTIKAKLENLTLAAPCVSFAVMLSRIVDIPKVQLDLSRDTSVNPDALPALLSELSAEIGPECLGVLRIESDHCPEARSRLVPLHDVHAHSPSRASLVLEPTRLLAKPICLGDIWPLSGKLVFAGREAFDVQNVAFDRRIGPLHWWTDTTEQRDYYRVWLSFGDRQSARHPATFANHGIGQTWATHPVACEGWVYVDRERREAFLQGYWE